METPQKRSPLPTIVGALAIIVVALLVFLPALRFGFVAYDDDSNVYNNVYLNPITSKTLHRFWSESYYELYTPVTYSIWTLTTLLPGVRRTTPIMVPAGAASTLNGGAFHMVGIGLHIGNALLLYALLLRLPPLKNRSPLFAALGTLLFAIHPLMAESVAWVTGNNNVFSGFFLLLALLLFVKRLEVDGTTDGPKNEKAALVWYIVATVAYLLALLAKPTAAALPFMAFALSVGIYRAPIRSLLLPLGTWLVLAGALLFVTRNTSQQVKDVSLPIWERPFVAGDALAFYLGKLIVPLHLGIDYGRRPEWLREQWWFYATWMIPVGIVVGLLLWYRHRGSEAARVLLTGLAVFGLGVSPMLGWAPYYFHRYSTVADRYVYVAMIGIALIVSTVLANLPSQRVRVGIGVASLALVWCAILCRQQTMVWSGSLSLFQHTVLINPKSMMGHNNLALALQDSKRLPEALHEAELAEECPAEGTLLPSIAATTRGGILFMLGRLPEAAAACRKAITLVPNRQMPYENLAVCLYDMGNKDGARAALEAASTAERTRAESAFGIGMLMLKNHLTDLGVPYLLEVARNGYPHAAEANFYLGVLSGNEGDNAGAEPFLRAAVKLEPTWGEAAYSLGRVLERQGKQQEAQTYYTQAEHLGYHPGL